MTSIQMEADLDQATFTIETLNNENEQLQAQNAEMLELLQGILGSHRMHEVILTAGYEKRISAVIANSKAA